MRPAGPADADAMCALVQAAYEMYVERIGRKPAPMTANYDRIAESGHAWVAERGKHIVGLVVLEPATDHLLLKNLAVSPHAQGHGVGRRLLRFAEEQTSAHGLREVRLFTNEAMTENLAYYPRHGYIEMHRSTQDGYRRVFFSRKLGSE